MCGKISGIAVVAIAALIVNCSADPHQEQDVSGNEHGSVSQYDGQNTRKMLDSMLKFARAMRDPRHYPYPGTRRYDWTRNPEYNALYLEGYPKRNFDEIDRSDLDSFVSKRNFDEIDLSLMPLPYTNKRFLRTNGRNNPDFPLRFRRAVDKKMLPNYFDKDRDFKMDEIDLSGFPITITQHLSRKR